MDELTDSREVQVSAFPDAELSFSSGGPSANDKNGSSLSSVNKHQEEMKSAHTVPTRLAYNMKTCCLCEEKFSLVWNEDGDEWEYENAVLEAEDGVIYHFTCSQNSTNEGKRDAKRMRQ